MQEIEAKFYIADLIKIRRRLVKLHAKLVQKRTHEVNIRFDTPNGSLRRKGRVLRLRQDDKARLTFKGPGKNRSGILSRTEIEFEVEDFETAKSFLESLGYEKLIFYEKFRTTYKLGTTFLMLDELPYGSFLEIEGKRKRMIKAFGDRLNLNWKAAVGSSYAALFERFCKNRKLKMKDLSFKNFRGIKVRPKDLSVIPADQ